MRLARLIILGLAAVCAFGVMSTGTAFAGLLAHWLVGGKLITGTEHIPFHYTSGVSRLWETGGLKVVIECKKDLGEGTLLPGNLDRVSKGEFTECQAYEAKLSGSTWVQGALICVVNNVTLKPSVSLLGFTLSLALANRFAPEKGNEFATIEFAESCPGELSGAVVPVTGQATGTTLASQENKEAEHNEQIFAIMNLAAGVTQEPEEWLLEADEPSSALKTTLTFGSATAAFESNELVLLNTAGLTFGPLK